MYSNFSLPPEKLRCSRILQLILQYFTARLLHKDREREREREKGMKYCEEHH